MRDVGTLGKQCHSLKIFGAGVLGGAVSAGPEVQAQVGATLPTQAWRTLLEACSRITEKSSAAVHGSMHIPWAGPELRRALQLLKPW